MTIKFTTLTLLLMSPIAGTIACAGKPPQTLVEARSAYQRAAQGPAASASPAQLHVARTSLDLAEQTYDDEGDSANARDRAYVALRKAELAEVQANILVSEQRTAAVLRQARAGDRAAMQHELASTRSQLALERDQALRQRSELEAERQRRKEADQRLGDAIGKLADVASIRQADRGTVITLSGAVIFASGKAELLPTARTKLAQVATALQATEPGTTFLVEGYTDSRGSAQLNEELSTRRAANVREYLVSQGIAADRITSRGLGPSDPIADNETAEGRANNRRVEIIVQSAAGAGSAPPGEASPQSAPAQSAPPRSTSPGQNPR